MSTDNEYISRRIKIINKELNYVAKRVATAELLLLVHENKSKKFYNNI